jgi:hypothetical protein
MTIVNIESTILSAYEKLKEEGFLHRSTFVELIIKDFGEIEAFKCGYLVCDFRGADRIGNRILGRFRKHYGDEYQYDVRMKCWIKK